MMMVTLLGTVMTKIIIRMMKIMMMIGLVKIRMMKMKIRMMRRIVIRLVLMPWKINVIMNKTSVLKTRTKNRNRTCVINDKHKQKMKMNQDDTNKKMNQLTTLKQRDNQEEENVMNLTGRKKSS